MESRLIQRPQLRKPRDLLCLFASIVASVGVLAGVIFLIATQTRSKNGNVSSSSSFAVEAMSVVSTEHPSIQPSTMPSTLEPTKFPSSQPTGNPSDLPTLHPSGNPSGSPSDSASAIPSIYPSATPSLLPSSHPTKFPSKYPSVLPTSFPSFEPSLTPSDEQSTLPSVNPTFSPSITPSATATDDPSLGTPSVSPQNVLFSTPTVAETSPNPTSNQMNSLTANPLCFSVEVYDSIDRDIDEIKTNISDDATRSHFLGGIVRLVAHDFMDYDRNDADKMGSDGCFDDMDDANMGLDTIWCEDCELTRLYKEKYSYLSRADFWIASAQAVIRQTSIDNALDLKDKFQWGRKDTDSCPGSADRLPTPSGCRSIQQVFLTRMGLDWKDAVALMGAHTLGRGNREFSGHHGTWVGSDEAAQVFDKTYYEELYRHAWRPRNVGTSRQDWIRGKSSSESPQMMLNTDICLVYDLDRNFPCCTRTNLFYSNGSNSCMNKDLENDQCRRYSENDSKMAATDAVKEYLGGTSPNTNNEPFYNAFMTAWTKATTLGWNNLSPLSESCEG